MDFYHKDYDEWTQAMRRDNRNKRNNRRSSKIASFHVPYETEIALEGRVNMDEAKEKGYTCTVPGSMDLYHMGSLEMRFRDMGISYGKMDVYPAFRSKTEMDVALLRVYQNGWEGNHLIEDYLVNEGLISFDDPEMRRFSRHIEDVLDGRCDPDNEMIESRNREIKTNCGNEEIDEDNESKKTSLYDMKFKKK
ncbi:hypothetical protein ACFL1H_04650 [Nanoarchaeota archaeon]